MFGNQNVSMGKYYVNRSKVIVREVVMINGQTVLFNTHHLDTGNSCGSPSECRILDFLNWADHEATPAELTSLHYRKGESSLGEELTFDWEEFHAAPPMS
jgi:hypothetical protein